MMKEITGGLWLGALGAGAFLGIIPGLVLFGLGSLIALCKLSQERQAEKQAENWRKTYPTYKY